MAFSKLSASEGTKPFDAIAQFSGCGRSAHLLKRMGD
jgi:hypothetical protein